LSTKYRTVGRPRSRRESYRFEGQHGSLTPSVPCRSAYLVGFRGDERRVGLAQHKVQSQQFPDNGGPFGVPTMAVVFLVEGRVDRARGEMKEPSAMERDSQQELRLPRRIPERLEREDALGVRHRR
jgi:hypothetical protein